MSTVARVPNRARRALRVAEPHESGHVEGLARLGFAPSTAELLRYFAVRSVDRVHLRRLERRFGPRSRSLQRDLAALVDLGALRRLEAEGRRVDYEVDVTWPLWAAVRTLVVGLTPLPDLVRDALFEVKGVEAAFVYGSVARGTARPESDVDVFVFGDCVDTRAMHRNLSEVAVLTGRSVNPGVYTRMKLAERLGTPNSPSRRFLRDVFAGPKEWVAGAAEALAPIAVAAGVLLTPPAAVPR